MIKFLYQLRSARNESFLQRTRELAAVDIKAGKFVLRDVLPVRIQVDDSKF